MLATLEPLFQGPFSALQDRVLLPRQVSAEVTPARRLFSSQGLEWVLNRYANCYVTTEQPLDRRALVSQWSKYFLSQALYIPVAANLVLDRHLPVSLDSLGLVLNDDGLVETLVVADEGRRVMAEGCEGRLRPLMESLLTPTIQVMAACTGIAPRALWSNAGHYFDYLIGQLQTLRDPPPAVGEGARLMTLSHFADGTRNPLYRPIHHVIDGAGETRRVRRVCCVRYRLPEVGYCGNCPLPAALARRPEEA